MSSDTPSRRSVLTGLAVLPATVAPVAARSDEVPAPTRTDGKPRHDPTFPDSDHVRTYYALARG
ncbi:hypothetical protein [Roseivivax isoporae]|uniref:Uncharacterized protein n=1 Tax=Roseivivax isoporae LMG 25204 TaxID=1449351 RepID=X7FAE1_9RHOB|nr:hypothetical protein [Roseivivax isoporae]ETX29051.1 hypothetical protein RISW2_03660 [Roseivivax isoporae LMG 25204]